MPFIYFGIKDYLGKDLLNARASIEPLGVLIVANNVRLPTEMVAIDGSSVDLPSGQYRVTLFASGLVIKGAIVVGGIDSTLAQLFLPNGTVSALPTIQIGNVVGLEEALDSLDAKKIQGIPIDEPTEDQTVPQYDLATNSIVWAAVSGTGGESSQPSRQYAPIDIASVNISALRVVARTLQGYAYADPSAESSANQMLALALSSVNSGSQIKPLIFGVVSDQSWNWQIDKPIFLDANGTLTQNPTSAIVRILGFPALPTEFFFNPQEGIV